MGEDDAVTGGSLLIRASWIGGLDSGLNTEAAAEYGRRRDGLYGMRVQHSEQILGWREDPVCIYILAFALLLLCSLQFPLLSPIVVLTY